MTRKPSLWKSHVLRRGAHRCGKVQRDLEGLPWCHRYGHHQIGDKEWDIPPPDCTSPGNSNSTSNSAIATAPPATATAITTARTTAITTAIAIALLAIAAATAVFTGRAVNHLPAKLRLHLREVTTASRSSQYGDSV
ncbi:hypothetical protein N656DRAFT_85193 [Canariomyces notabilis]|uniref:Uncharacterized protein n=1 Tax=Canariomyces notabilis TaxID=2074819 RepID=A0AAN6TDC6_9PEZI|nr:hypothetical protein N656DRAFT_85193 [Canariomyces arenarius]